MGLDLKKRELGTGYSQRKDGRYMARITINGEQIVLYNMSLTQLKKDFEIVKEEAVKKKLSGFVNTKLTLDEWFDVWYSKYKAPKLKNASDGAYKRLYKNYYGCRIGSKPLTSIKQLDIQCAISDLLEEGRTSKTIKDSTSILRACIEAAQANGFMTINPTLGVEIPEGVAAKRRVLTEDEQCEFIEYIDSMKNWYSEMYKFMLITGMRIGEIGGLQWGDIDFTRKLIFVRRALSVQYEDGVKTSVLTTPKTPASVRQIPFFEETEPLLLAWREKVEARKKVLGKRWRLGDEYGDLVFVTSFGSPVSRHNAESDMRNVTKQMNLTRFYQARETGILYEELDGIHPHCLRHTFATRCLEKRMPLRYVQSMLGHTNINITASYSHAIDDMVVREAKLVGKFFAKAPTHIDVQDEYNLLVFDD